MKKIVLLCLTIVLISYNYSFGFSAGFMGSGAAKNAGGGGCATPSGDIKTEGFEGTGYELGANWTENNGTPDEDFTLSGLSGGAGDATRNCDTGLQINQASEDVTLDSGSALAHAYVEFSIYVDSQSINWSATYPVYAWGSVDSDFTFVFALKDAGGTITVYGTGATSSTERTISLDTWYYVQMDGSDNGTGTITIGTTYGGTDIANGDTFTCRNADNNPRYYEVGESEGKTVSFIIGYFVVDDDGTF